MSASRTGRASASTSSPLIEGAERFRREFTTLFDAEFSRLFRYLDRSSGDPELAADLAQEAFARLYRRGALPESPVAWLVSVAMNLLRNERSKRARRIRLLTVDRARRAHSDGAPLPGSGSAGDTERRRVRAALDRLPERERSLLLLRAEGYAYRELAAALGLEEASVGTLLARAKTQFRQAYEEVGDAP